MTAGKLVRAAARLIEILGEGESSVVGGLAVAAHGFVRATRDVDILVSISLQEARRRLERQGIDVRLFRGDPSEGDFSCLKGVVEVDVGRGRVERVPFDILPQLVSLEIEKTIDLEWRGQKLRVCDMDMLIRLKLKAGSIKDLYDIAILVILHPEWEDRARSHSAFNPMLKDRLATLIEDPRVRGEARELKRQDALLGEFPAPKTRKRRPSPKG